MTNKGEAMVEKMGQLLLSPSSIRYQSLICLQYVRVTTERKTKFSSILCCVSAKTGED